MDLFVLVHKSLRFLSLSRKTGISLRCYWSKLMLICVQGWTQGWSIGTASAGSLWLSTILCKLNVLAQNHFTASGFWRATLTMKVTWIAWKVGIYFLEKGIKHNPYSPIPRQAWWIPEQPLAVLGKVQTPLQEVAQILWISPDKFSHISQFFFLFYVYS